MAEAFKDTFDADLAERFVEQLEGPGFHADAFRQHVLPLPDAMALKTRVARFADALQQALPSAFPEAVEVLRPRLPPPLSTTEAVASTFAWWPLCTFVERHGRDHPDVALPFLRRLTKTFSAEFAVRPFLDAAPQATLATLIQWLDDPNPHVRRWISEGTRPRLPWGQRLSGFTADPEATLPLLQALHDDDSPYVRRSVANHLGDIAKDHPNRAVAVASGWAGGGPVPATGGNPTDALVRHGLRHLVKQGHPGALALMGFGPPTVDATLTLSARVVLGGHLDLELELANPTESPQALLVDVGIRFLGARDTLRKPKVFKWTTLELGPAERVRRTRALRLADVTTRTHHPGRQEVVVWVNGHGVAEGAFELLLPPDGEP